MKHKYALALLGCAVLLTAAAPNSAGQRWWQYVRDLAADKFEGRATASSGHQQAAAYVASEFKRLGLRPAASGGYLQPVALRVRRIREDASSLTLLRGRIQEVLQLGEDAYFSLVTDPPPSLQAPAVFAGYGLTVPELNYDDLAGVDLKGKIAVVFRGGPESIPGPVRAHYQSLRERWPFLRKAGAVGLISIPDPRSLDIPWERLKLLRLDPFMALAGSEQTDTPGLMLAATVNPASGDKLLAGSGHSMDEILRLAEAGAPLPSFPLPGVIRAEVSVESSETSSDNVAGILRGRDARLRQEYVVVSAHLDHLGTGAAVNGDSIYNGAMDDAAGVASLLEIARLLKAALPRRSVIFVAVTGEEEGLLGSRHFAASPPVDRQAIVADLNLDMFQPLHSLRLLTVYGLDESSLGRDVRAVARQFGVGVQGDQEPERNLFVRSDQYSFIRAGIPSLAFKFGFTKGSREEQIQQRWLKERYHAPSDDTSQPVDLAAAARFNRLIGALASRVANQPQRPQWNSNSFFRRFARSGN
jgi:hypothetical protein